MKTGMRRFDTTVRRLCWIGLYFIIILTTITQMAPEPRPVLGSTVPYSTLSETTIVAPASGSTVPPTVTPTPTPELPPSPTYIPQELDERYNVPTIITTEPVSVPDEDGGGRWITEWEVTARTRVEAIPGGWLAIEYADSWPTYSSYVGENAAGEDVYIDIPYPLGIDIGVKTVALQGISDSSMADTRLTVIALESQPFVATMWLTYFPVEQATLADEQIVGVQYDRYDGSFVTVILDSVLIGSYLGGAQDVTIRSDGFKEGVTEVSIATVSVNTMTNGADLVGEYSVTGVSGTQFTQLETALGALYIIAEDGVNDVAAEIRILRSGVGDLFVEVTLIDGTDRLIAKIDSGGTALRTSTGHPYYDVNPEELPDLPLFVLNKSDTVLQVFGGLAKGAFYAAPPQALYENRLYLSIIE
jgi:hypothetical protein